MSTMTLAAPTLAGLHMTSDKAARLRVGDLVSLSGDWCTVAAPVLIENEHHASIANLIVAPVTDPERTRSWSILADARIAILRAINERGDER